MPSTTPMPLPRSLSDIDGSTAPVSCHPRDYPAGWEVAPHVHAKHQLVYAVRGVVTVRTAAGRWVVPPTRGIWMLAGTTHAIHCLGEVNMRSLYVQPGAAPGLPTQSQVVGISPLLRELIGAAAEVRGPYAPNSRDGRLMRLILDELRALPVLPLHLLMPSDARLACICERLQQRLDDPSTLSDWARRLDVDVKTIQRLFAAQTGMTFGQWRKQARLLKALEMLAAGRKIIDVALATGYDSPSAFATMFRKHFGQAPSAFFTQA